MSLDYKCRFAFSFAFFLIRDGEGRFFVGWDFIGERGLVVGFRVSIFFLVEKTRVVKLYFFFLWIVWFLLLEK